VNHDPIAQFKTENAEKIATYPSQQQWHALSNQWMQHAFTQRYMYHFSWMGRPIIQTPNDMVALQEIIWQVKPDLIIETGIAHGGSLILSASLLALLDEAEAVANHSTVDPRASKRKVIGIDIDIRAHNRAAIEAHPMAHRIQMIEGSSIAPETLAKVKAAAAGYKNILVCLDSHHTHEHVKAELALYTPFVAIGSYCVVYDTVVEDMPPSIFPDRDWAPGNNPKTAVWEFIDQQNTKPGSPRFEIDRSINDKLMITAAPEGWLKRIG
jgi:cephalosporin hydroxylase